MTQKIQSLHSRAIEVSGQYRKCEGELIDLLQELDHLRGYLHFGSNSLYDYCLNHLKLSEGATSNLITVARKAFEVPELKMAIQSGSITVSKARKITPVLTKANQEGWLKLATTQTSRQLEKAVASMQPQLAIRETTKYKAEDRIERVVGVSENLNKLLERVIDLESQRTKKAAKFEDALQTMAELYLQKNDPLRKAERQSGKSKSSTKLANLTARDSQHVPGHISSSGRRPLQASLIHAVNLRDHRQCAHRDQNGKRCLNTRWLEVHHIIPVVQGGQNTIENLTTLCSPHHRMIHGSKRQKMSEQSVLV